MSHRGEHVLSGGFQRHPQEARNVMPRWVGFVVSCSVALSATALLARPASHAIAPPLRAASARALQDLGGIPELTALFDRESDKVRILMLLSPT